jgi:hypothetical protein
MKSTEDAIRAFHSPEMLAGACADAAAQSHTAGVRMQASRFMVASRYLVSLTRAIGAVDRRSALLSLGNSG